jgi:hypothetical protein
VAAIGSGRIDTTLSGMTSLSRSRINARHLPHLMSARVRCFLRVIGYLRLTKASDGRGAQSGPARNLQAWFTHGLSPSVRVIPFPVDGRATGRGSSPVARSVAHHTSRGRC